MNITDEKQYITLCYISYFLDSIYCQNGNKTHLKDINNITHTQINEHGRVISFVFE